MEYPKVCLRRGEEAGVLKGQRLIYDNELDWADDICTDGCVVDVLDSRQRFAARGFFNSASRLAVRVLTRDENEPIDRAFFVRRIEAAWRARQALGFSDSCRVVFGESDGLPGLTVDKFADCLSFQIVSLGMERWKDDIVAILAELFQPQGIYERDDVAVREKEGLPQIKECVYGTVPEEIEIREHDARMLVSIENGQKTGHFLDQQENRGHLRPYSAGRTVLDLCCYSGGFSIAAKMLGGAAEVTAVDLDEKAVAMAKRNGNINRQRIDFVHADAFVYARQMVRNGRLFDAVLLDPPKFIVGRDGYEEGIKKYHDLNMLGLQCVRPGGLFVTCSCSGLLSPAEFEHTVIKAAQRQGRKLQIMAMTGPGWDHPFLSTYPEGRYLKVLWAIAL